MPTAPTPAVRAVDVIASLACVQQPLDASESLLSSIGHTVLLHTSNLTRTREVHGEACVSLFPLRPRATKGNVCTDPFIGYQDYLETVRLPAAWAIASDASQTHLIVVDNGIGDHFELPVFARFPLTDDSIGSHATSVAGVAASRHNQIGICGASPVARIVDINLLARTHLSDAAEALAFVGEHVQWNGVYCNSWGPVDDGRCDGPGYLLEAALLNGTRVGRAGLGSVYVFAAGNGGKDENMNDDGYANSPYTISVAATGALEPHASATFSEWGSSITLSAPGFRVLTTALPSGFGYFYGTSAAAPLVAGTVSLMLATNSDLGWRDVQEILMTSSAAVQHAGHIYTRNKAGMRYSYHLGSGLLDASAAVTLSSMWHTPLRPQTSIRVHANARAQRLPVLVAFPVRELIRVEHVRLCVQLDDGNQRSDGSSIGAWIASPHRTRAYLTRPTARVSSTGCSYANWCFTSLLHWGEGSKGVWTLVVEDHQLAAQFAYNMSLELMGSRTTHGFDGCSNIS